MIFKPKTPSTLPKSATKPPNSNLAGNSNSNNLNNMLDPIPGGHNPLSGPPLPHPASGKIIGQTSLLIESKNRIKDKRHQQSNNSHHNTQNLQNSKKGPTREEVFTKIDSVVTNLLAKESTNEAIEQWKEEAIPSKMTQTAVTHLFKIMIEKDPSMRELVLAFISQLTKDEVIDSMHCNEALIKLLQVSNNNNEILAEIASWSVIEGVSDLKAVGEITEGSYSVYFLTLQRLSKDWGQNKLLEVFESSEVKLMDHIPQADKSDNKLVKVLEEHELAFLMPLLSLQKEMEAQLTSEVNPTNFAKWIGDCVEVKFHTNPEFVMALIQVVFKHIVDSTTQGDPNADKGQIEAEKELLSKFRLVLKPFVHDKPKLQLAAVYALQVFCNSRGFPKGLLLRSFVNFYEMDIVDEHSFLQWKEDVNDSYPGKGKALFQVNSWLTWLEEAESDEEDEDEDED
jgi:translation initiation factor 4G